MALVLSGSLVVASSSAQAVAGTFGELKECVADVVGGRDQAKILELAGRGIQRGIDELNMRNLFDFGRKSAADTTIVDGTSDYTLPADFFAISEVQLIKDGNPYRTLVYLPWDQFGNIEPNQDDTGTPTHWTAKNTFDDGTIQIYPEPDAQAASDYTLRITYYERVSQPTADGDVINGPRELREVLCTYGEYYLLFDRDPSSNRWQQKRREAERKMLAFRNSRKRQPSESLQWRIATAGYYPTEFDPLGDR